MFGDPDFGEQAKTIEERLRRHRGKDRMKIIKASYALLRKTA